MKGRYTGRTMSVYGAILPGAARLARLTLDLSKQGRGRLKWFDYYERHKHNASLTARYFGISRQTFYRWKRRYNPRNLSTLETRPHRPRHLRQPTWSSELATAVQRVREANPRWGKDKLVLLLRAEGWAVSTSMVGRILGRLRDRGVLQEPWVSAISARKRHWRRPYGVRKPKGYKPVAPGDLVQVDTLDVRPLPGVVRKQFTARDVVSRWDVLEIYSQATATTATRFLDALQARSPFTIRAIQVDGGSEFMAGFEEACRQRGILLFVLPPRSPKLNGCVERANRTHTEEFYELYDGDLDLPTLRTALLVWEERYNTFRPHQALNYLTPAQFLGDYSSRKEEVSPII
jgi:putative transposase